MFKKMIPLVITPVLLLIGCNKAPSPVYERSEYSKALTYSNGSILVKEENVKWENHLIKQIKGRNLKNPDRNITYLYEYTYDNNGNLLSETNLSYEDNVLMDKRVTTTEYDEHQNVIKKMYYMNSDLPQAIDTYDYKYDDRGNPLEIIHSYAEDGEITSKNKKASTYDNENRLLSLKSSRYTEESEYSELIDDYEITYSYVNKNLNFSTSEYYEFREGNKILTDSCVNDINENDVIKSSTLSTFDSEGDLDDKIITYFTYHEKGFVTSEEEYYLVYRNRKLDEPSLSEKTCYTYFNDDPDRVVLNLKVKCQPPTSANSERMQYIFNTYDSKGRLIEKLEETKSSPIRVVYQYEN